MKLTHRWLGVSLFVAICVALGGRHDAGAQAPATITILHFNDIYEIDAIEGDASADCPASPHFWAS